MLLATDTRGPEKKITRQTFRKRWLSTHTSGAFSPKALQNDLCTWITYSPGRETPHLTRAVLPNKNLPDREARGGLFVSCFQPEWASILKSACPTLTEYTILLVHICYILQHPFTVNISVSSYLNFFFSKQHTIDTVLLCYSVILCLLIKILRLFNVTWLGLSNLKKNITHL